MYNIKSALAEQASTLIQDGFVVMLDASTTASHLVKYLERFKDIIVITCGIKTAYMLNIKFLCTGGESINKSFSLIGQSAISTIREYNADICFVSCHGLSPSGYATDTSVPENEIRHALMRQSRIKVLMLDNTKIDNGFWHNLCDISEFDAVICNEELPPKIMERVKNFYSSIKFIIRSAISEDFAKKGLGMQKFAYRGLYIPLNLKNPVFSQEQFIIYSVSMIKSSPAGEIKTMSAPSRKNPGFTLRFFVRFTFELSRFHRLSSNAEPPPRILC